MQAMGELSRVMEDCAAEAVAILSQLPSPDGEGADGEYDPATAAQAYDVASDMGDSIAPSQSASQAMSRASSSSSLDEEFHTHANAPPIPNDLRIDSPRSASPAPAPPRSPAPPFRAKSPLRAPTNAPQPIMPAVPSAPPPISNKAYVERVAGMPTFDIPKAPDLSRRPDDSDSESDYGEGNNVAAIRSRHYPLDSPPLRGHESHSRLRRRAMSDTSSVNEGAGGGGRKRRGSFFGGIASLFSRNKGGSNRRDRQREPSGGSAPPDFDYASARSRLAGTGAGGGGAAAAAAESRNDAVLRSVLNAGKLPGRRGPRGGGGDEGYSSDEDVRPTTRHVNDPKERFKAFSDVGRSSSPAAAARSTRASHAPATSEVATSRPKLQRKGTSTSTVRPLSTIEPNGAPTAEPRQKKTRKVKKAASDIGPASAVPPGWSTGAPLGGAATLEVPRAPGRGDGIDGLARGGGLPLAPPSPPPAAAAPAFAPRSSGTPASPAETGSLRCKKTKKAAGGAGGVTQPNETVVLSAEALGIPTAGAGAGAAAQPAHPGLSRSNTTSTTATAMTASGERKKKKKIAKPAPASAATTNGPPPALAAPLMTSDDLAASLPKSQSGNSALTAQLPRPDDDPHTASLASRPLSVPAPAAARPAWMNKDDSNKPVKALADKEKKSKRMSSLHGVTNDTWVTNPNAASAAPRATRRAEGHAGEESLLAVVDRAEGNERTSRSYGTGALSLSTQGLAPASAATASLPSPSGALNAALPSAPPAQNNLPSSQAVLPRPPTLEPPAPQLTKRKSVRLAETADAGPPPISASMSPSASMRSSSSAGQPRHGILIQRDASPAPGSVAASLGERGASPARGGDAAQSNGSAGGGGGGGGVAGAWPTRASIRAAMDDSSSDSDGEGRRAYRQARKMLGRGTKEMDDAMAGRTKAPTREEKGKARAVDA